MGDPYVGPQRPQHPRDQRKVVVLHQHRRTLGGLVGERLGEGTVVGLVRRPLRPELRIEDRLQRGLVQHVVDEPQHGVRDAVVGGGMHPGRNIQHPHTLPAGVTRLQRTTRPPYGLPVAVTQRRTHPHRIGIGPDGRQPGHQPAPAPLGGERAVLRQAVGDRPAIGRDQNLGTRWCRTALGDHVAKVTRDRSAQTHGSGQEARAGECSSVVARPECVEGQRRFTLRGFRMPAVETVAAAAGDTQRVAERARQAAGRKA